MRLPLHCAMCKARNGSGSQRDKVKGINGYD
jgi:hypothetical protein